MHKSIFVIGEEFLFVDSSWELPYWFNPGFFYIFTGFFGYNFYDAPAEGSKGAIF